MRVEKELVVNAPVEKVYQLWTDFENFPKFMEHVQEVTRSGENNLHWKANIGGRTLEWDARVVGMVENRTVTWRSTSGSENAGAVTLASSGHTTLMHVVIEYEPSFIEAVLDTVTRFTSRSVEDDLERFKRLAEGLDPEREAQLHSERSGVARIADAVGGAAWEAGKQADDWESTDTPATQSWEAGGAQGDTSTSTGAGNGGAVSPSSLKAAHGGVAGRVRDTISSGDADWERDAPSGGKEGVLDHVGDAVAGHGADWEASGDSSAPGNPAEQMVDNAIADLRGGDWEREEGEGGRMNRAADAMGGAEGGDWEGRAGGAIGRAEQAVGGAPGGDWEGDSGSGVLNRVEQTIEGDRDDWERQHTPVGAVPAATSSFDTPLPMPPAAAAALGITEATADSSSADVTDAATAADSDSTNVTDTATATDNTTTASDADAPAGDALPMSGPAEIGSMTDDAAARLSGGPMGPSSYIDEASGVLPAGEGAAMAIGSTMSSDAPEPGSTNVTRPLDTPDTLADGVTDVTGADFNTEGSDTEGLAEGGAAASYAMPIDTTQETAPVGDTNSMLNMDGGDAATADDANDHTSDSSSTVNDQPQASDATDNTGEVSDRSETGPDSATITFPDPASDVSDAPRIGGWGSTANRETGGEVQ